VPPWSFEVPSDISGPVPHTPETPRSTGLMAYLLQLWGSQLWDAADLADVGRSTIKLLDATRPDTYGRLDAMLEQMGHALPPDRLYGRLLIGLGPGDRLCG
jgi:hypothetical protein